MRWHDGHQVAPDFEGGLNSTFIDKPQGSSTNDDDQAMNFAPLSSGCSVLVGDRLFIASNDQIYPAGSNGMVVDNNRAHWPYKTIPSNTNKQSVQESRVVADYSAWGQFESLWYIDPPSRSSA